METQKDWSEYHVSLQPLARQLFEQLNRREYNHGLRTANELIDILLNIKGVCLHHRERA
jgi:hypothetical protein